MTNEFSPETTGAAFDPAALQAALTVAEALGITVAIASDHEFAEEVIEVAPPWFVRTRGEPQPEYEFTIFRDPSHKSGVLMEGVFSPLRCRYHDATGALRALAHYRETGELLDNSDEY
jgi:hypothetical protein